MRRSEGVKFLGSDARTFSGEPCRYIPSLYDRRIETGRVYGDPPSRPERPVTALCLGDRDQVFTFAMNRLLEIVADEQPQRVIGLVDRGQYGVRHGLRR